VAPPPEVAPPAPKPQAPAGEPAPESGGEQQGAPDEPQLDASVRQPYLTRVLEHIPGDAGDSAPPHAPTP
ncbi:hypothetical protein H7H80_18295, partial [Mycobacterium interjectum]|nr:hypothetical protein [Mycobacterium interjectum]